MHYILGLMIEQSMARDENKIENVKEILPTNGQTILNNSILSREKRQDSGPSNGKTTLKNF